MKNIIVITEIENTLPKKSSLELISKLSDQNVQAVFTEEVSPEGARLASKAGAKRLVQLTSNQLNDYSSENYAKAIAHLCQNEKYDYIFASSSLKNKDFLPRLSAELESPYLSEIVDLNFAGDDLFLQKPLYAGKCLGRFKSKNIKNTIISSRPNSFHFEEKNNNPTDEIEKINVELNTSRGQVKRLDKNENSQKDLTEAEIIVSGGRALKNSENFSVLQELAAQLNATVGASRAAVDAGYAPHSMQVGQTGKIVSPKLYIACGISGAIQHIAGMRTSKKVLAINNDPQAPIFEMSDFGIVGDLFKIVPALAAEIKKNL